jgi:hypothetical protein
MNLPSNPNAKRAPAVAFSTTPKKKHIPRGLDPACCYPKNPIEQCDFGMNVLHFA